ncbi:uncharacterized protein EAF01_008707 [Botrytis porri]|uniref:uncharacterized protein n=1 Tax=Botrytis porri TaxID=87229 RepID=UPI0019004495|nr:uncharacterized protein EAF01_008707 [Botrytis porri]KAF7897741.1 hypothetical protein EAF01_008707 [Botrytis porri]
MDAYLSPRPIGTASQPRNLPLFPITKFVHLTDPNVFVISRLLMAWFHYLLWRIVTDLQGHYQAHLQVGDYSPEREQFFRRLSHLTIREIGIRILLPVLWILPEVLSISAHHYCISAVAVFIGGAKAIPGWNHPVYGLLTEAYTVRKYWGLFWHQFLRRDLIAWASFMSSKIFRIPQNSRFNKFAMLNLVFFVSACMHAMICIPAKIKFSNCRVSHIFQWYLLCPCAIVAEDLVQKWGKEVLRHYGWRRDSRWHYWLGIYGSGVSLLGVYLNLSFQRTIACLRETIAFYCVPSVELATWWYLPQYSRIIYVDVQMRKIFKTLPRLCNINSITLHEIPRPKFERIEVPYYRVMSSTV